jgi:predicted lipid-binding transport protein (Tim44 family)
LLPAGAIAGWDLHPLEKRRLSTAHAETRLLSIDAADITAAELRGKTAYITLRFVSQLVSATRDLSGKIIDGG